MNDNSLKLNFKVSTALKNIIGRDLINDRFIAVFELVKNSYDAGANNVVIEFENLYTDKAKIIISDDGCGMSLEDIREKWLFVAYSEKKHIHRGKSDYREKIKRQVAGAKGVGRFSCDRLGAELIIKTKTLKQNNASQVIIDWNAFEVDDTQEFVEMEVEHEYIANLGNNHAKGTVLEISKLREVWKRSDLLILKRSLMKLVNPSLDVNDDEFNIEIVCMDEKENDKKFSNERDIVNGFIKNDILEKLNIRTTSIQVKISEDSSTITTILNDRGEFIFEIREANEEYTLLKNIDFSIFYLNRSAKVNFTSSMGIQLVNYGSIFVYKNGFRIYPYGEPGNDIFDIDRRKAQGYNRYLGTRDLMGRIQILGENSDFTETTSRDGGFINTPAVEQLFAFFKEKVLKTLEKYVIDTIDWGDPSKEDGVEQELMPKDVVDKIVLHFADFARRGEILSVRYGDNILNYVNAAKEQSLEGSISKLEKVAIKTNNSALIDLAQKVKTDAEKLKKQKQEAEKEVEVIKTDLKKAQKEIDFRKKQVYFLKNAGEKNTDYLLGGMHSILRGSDGLRKDVRALSIKLLSEYPKVSNEIKELISLINLKTQKIRKLSDYGISGNFSLKSDRIKDDIAGFIKQYIEVLTTSEIKSSVEIKDNKPYICSFNATSIGMIIDNIASNSVKATATRLYIYIKDDDNYIYISFKDNGKGIDTSVTDTNNLFELGFSTTQGGFGMGLYHVKKMLQTMNGTITVNSDCTSGFELIVRLKNEHRI